MQEDLLNFESIARWMSNFPDRPNTKKNYLIRFRKFISWIRKDPDTLIAEAKRNPLKIHNKLKEYYNFLIRHGFSSKTAILSYNCVRSFFKWNDIFLGPTPRGFKGRVEYESFHVLTPEEIAKMVDVCSSIRDKCVIVFLAQSGQRSGVLTALRYGHVKSGLERGESPLIIEVPAVLRDINGVNVNKLGESYRFAVGNDSIVCLKMMLKERIENGETLDKNSWLFRSYSKVKVEKNGKKRPIRASKNERGMPLTTAAIREIVNKAALKAGLQGKASEKRYEIHPHIFRRYWNMRMQEAGLSEDLRDFMLGHKLPYGGAYSKWYPDAIRRVWISKNIEKYITIPSKTIYVSIELL